jgi:hypothetical protein
MQIRDFITSLDSSAPKPLEEFHFDKGSYNKTFIGGCLSIAASLFLAYFLYFEFVSMQARDGTKFTSVNTKYEEKVNIEAFEMPMFIFGLEDTSIEEFVEID